jgi:hypothetical protein
MTAMTPVERVAEPIGSCRIQADRDTAGHRRAEFEFPAVFVGKTGASLDLIIVADTAFESEGRIQQKVEGLARALDGMRSRRPLTVILTGPRPRGATLDGLSQVCRVLPAGDAAHNEMLENALAVLLPLNLPEPKDDLTDIRNVLQRRLGERDPITDDLVVAAYDGKNAVRERLHELIAEPFDALDFDQEDKE